MGEMGLFGCCFPERLGGNGAGFRALAAVAENLAWVYPPLSAPMNLQAATVPLTIANWGTPELVERYVPGLVSAELLGCNAMTEPDGGSDFLGAMRTRAVRDGDDYVINGAKMWITNANVADVAVVYAKTDPAAGHKGVTAFLVPTSTPGFEATRVPCRVLGKLMPTNSVTFTDVRVPRPRARVRGTGLRRRHECHGLRPAVGRRPLGRPGPGLPGRRAGVRRPADGVRREDRRVPDGQEAARRHDREVAAARALVQLAAAGYDEGTVATRESSIAKYYAGEVCNRAAQACAEIFGGVAFSDELPVSIYLNYAKLWQTGEGSANIQAVLIADDALGWKDMDRHRTPLPELV